MPAERRIADFCLRASELTLRVGSDAERTLWRHAAPLQSMMRDVAQLRRDRSRRYPAEVLCHIGVERTLRDAGRSAFHVERPGQLPQKERSTTGPAIKRRLAAHPIPDFEVAIDPSQH